MLKYYFTNDELYEENDLFDLDEMTRELQTKTDNATWTRAERITHYLNVDFRVKAQVGTDCGAGGKFFEMLLKPTAKRKSVSGAGMVDKELIVNGKRCRCEVKTGSGELWDRFDNGASFKRFSNMDYVIYCARPDAVQPNVFLIPTQEFIYLCEQNDRLRLKCSSAVHAQYKQSIDYIPGSEIPDEWLDKVTLKSNAKNCNYEDIFDEYYNAPLTIAYLEQRSKHYKKA